MQVSGQSTATLGPSCRPMKVLYSAPAVPSYVSVCVCYLSEHWTKIAVAAIAGLLAGFFAGAVSSREYTPLTQVVYAAGVATNRTAPTVLEKTAAQSNVAEQATLQEVSRLKAENQQLQALVDELQKELPATHSRKVRAHHRRRSGAHV